MRKFAFLAAFLLIPVASFAGHRPQARVAIINGQAVVVVPQRQLVVIQAPRQRPRPKPGLIRRVLKRVL